MLQKGGWNSNLQYSELTVPVTYLLALNSILILLCSLLCVARGWKPVHYNISDFFINWLMKGTSGTLEGQREKPFCFFPEMVGAAAATAADMMGECRLVGSCSRNTLPEVVAMTGTLATPAAWCSWTLALAVTTTAQVTSDFQTKARVGAHGFLQGTCGGFNGGSSRCPMQWVWLLDSILFHFSLSSLGVAVAPSN